MTTLDELIALLAREFKVPPTTIEPDKSLAAYGLDSLALVELMFTVEEHFDIDIPLGSARIDTLADLARLIDTALAQSVGATAVSEQRPTRPGDTSAER